MKGKNIAFGGVLIALTLATLYLANLIPINTLALLTIASCYIPIAIINCDFKTGILIYISSSALSFFIIPINISIMYGLFFGLYGMIKYFIEKLNNLPLELFIKFIFINLSLILIMFLFKSSLGYEISSLLFLFLLNIAFFVFDYALTLIITFYLSKIHPKLK